MKGFHLIEFIIVLAILSILTSVGWHYSDQLTTRFRLKMSSENLISLMEAKRTSAILNHQTCQIIFFPSEIRFRFKKDNSSAWQTEELIETFHPVKLSASSPVSFYSNGFASPKTIQLSLNKQIHRLIININGRIRYESI